MLQLFGGTPEGFVGFIIGKMIKNTQMITIGIYSVVFRALTQFYIFYGKNGLIKDLFSK